MQLFQVHGWCGLTGLLVLILLSFSHGWDFSQKRVGVHFDPYVSRHDVERWDEYDEADILFLLTKIASTFKLIMVPLAISSNTSNISSDIVPNAVAHYNEQRNNFNEEPLRLLVWFPDPTDVPVSVSFQFPFLKAQADKINAIFQRTVQYLMVDLIGGVHFDESWDSTVGLLQQYHSSLTANFTQYSYLKLGIMLQNEFCIPGNTTKFSVENLFRLTSHVDFVMFEILPTVQDAKSGKFSAITFLERFKNCLVYVRDKVKNNVEVGFRTEWSDTPTVGAQNMSNLVHFWKIMSNWAELSETTIVFNQAFDTPTNPEIRHRTTGWWRLVESSTYKDALDYKFEAKEDPNPPNLNNTEWLSALFPNDKGPNFEHANLIPTFCPYVYNQSFSQFENQLKSNLFPTLNLVSQEFAKVSVEISHFEQMEVSNWDVLKGVAQLKKEQKLPQALEVVVIVTCQTCDEQNYDIHYLRSLINSTQFVNRESTNTVKTMLLNYDQVNDSTVTKILFDFKTLRNISKYETEPPNQPLNFGALLDINHCGVLRHYIFPYTTAIVNQVDAIVFAITPTAMDVKLGVEASLGGIFRQFKFCKHKVLGVKQNVKIGFMVEWPDTDSTGVQNIGNLVHFWGRVRDWAKETNTTVFINEAFDIPYRGENVLRSRGWWRLMTPNTFTTSEFIFEDKKSAFSRMLTTPDEQVPPAAGVAEHETINLIAVIIPTGVATLAIFGFVGVILYSKYLKRQIATLTKSEIHDFFYGNGATLLLNGRPGNYETPAYNTALECSRDEFAINEEKILGSGEFGLVFLAKLQRNGVETQVAAKTTKPPTSATALKGMLSEIRILCYVGKHQNIVSIVGAYTAQLAQGKVYAFTEFCQFGSLKDYLVEIVGQVVQPSITIPENNNVGYVRLFQESNKNDALVVEKTYSEMKKWAREICCGMEFLALKRVVHADLAARNVLLTTEKVAKITDFGLSRRLYAYETYVKKQKEALPWRWMSPESLRQLEFNEKTDVWSFGVTLWEIFSCGQIPYAGHAWGPEFVDKLENGMRLQKPRCGQENFYAIMLKCWDAKSHRPVFSQLQVILKEAD